jgi:hypothetical protein
VSVFYISFPLKIKPEFWELFDPFTYIMHCNRKMQQKWNIPDEMPLLPIKIHQTDGDEHSTVDTKNTSKLCKTVTVTNDIRSTY